MTYSIYHCHYLRCHHHYSYFKKIKKLKKTHVPEASLEYCRDRRPLLSLVMAVGMSGCETVLSRLPLVRPQRSQRDLRSTSPPEMYLHPTWSKDQHNQQIQLPKDFTHKMYLSW